MAAQEYYNPSPRPSAPQQGSFAPGNPYGSTNYPSSPTPTQGPPPPYSVMPGPSQPQQYQEKPQYPYPPSPNTAPQFIPSNMPQNSGSRPQYSPLPAQNPASPFRPPQPYSPGPSGPHYPPGQQTSYMAQYPPAATPHRRSSHDHVRFKTPSPSRSRSRSRSRTRRHRHHRNSHSNPKGSKDKGTFDTFLGAGGGAIIGDAIFPGLGTVGGALLGGYGGHRHAEKRRDRTSRRDYDRGYDSDSSVNDRERRRRH